MLHKSSCVNFIENKSKKQQINKISETKMGTEKVSAEMFTANGLSVTSPKNCDRSSLSSSCSRDMFLQNINMFRCVVLCNRKRFVRFVTKCERYKLSMVLYGHCLSPSHTRKLTYQKTCRAIVRILICHFHISNNDTHLVSCLMSSTRETETPSE